MRTKGDVIQRIKHGLILDHISKKVIKDGILAAGNVAMDKRAEFLVSMVGTTEVVHDINKETSDVVHVDTATVMGMSDEARMDLYNKILKSVGINESA